MYCLNYTFLLENKTKYLKQIGFLQYVNVRRKSCVKILRKLFSFVAQTKMTIQVENDMRKCKLLL